MNYTSPEEFNKIWNKPVIRVGMTTVLLAALFSFAPVVWLCISQRVLPPIGQILQSWALVAASFGALYICRTNLLLFCTGTFRNLSVLSFR